MGSVTICHRSSPRVVTAGWPRIGDPRAYLADEVVMSPLSPPLESVRMGDLYQRRNACDICIVYISKRTTLPIVNTPFILLLRLR